MPYPKEAFDAMDRFLDLEKMAKARCEDMTILVEYKSGWFKRRQFEVARRVGHVLLVRQNDCPCPAKIEAKVRMVSEDVDRLLETGRVSRHVAVLWRSEPGDTFSTEALQEAAFVNATKGIR